MLHSSAHLVVMPVSCSPLHDMKAELSGSCMCLCRYWTAATQGLADSWIAHYGALINQYGNADGVLTQDIIEQQIPKTRLYLCSIYWALTTVSLHARDAHA